MTAKEFIINSLDSIVNKFPCVQCTYQFDRLCGLHSVEVLPKAYLNDPDGFGELQFNITKQFISQFPDERLSFFTAGNSLEIESDQLVYKVMGRFYVDQPKDLQLFPDNNIHIENVDSLIYNVDYASAA